MWFHAALHNPCHCRKFKIPVAESEKTAGRCSVFDSSVRLHKVP